MGFSTVNGRAFIGNTPTFRARINELVEWQVLAIGNEFHTFHLHGHRWREAGKFIDTRVVGPAESFRLEDVAGSWLYHCHVEDHQTSGMIGIYRVAGRTRAAALAQLADRL
jgi:FtsP/CotA-like multicopper oxidase with cupredoxin domain